MFSEETFKVIGEAFSAINACHQKRGKDDTLLHIVEDESNWPKGSTSFRGPNNLRQKGIAARSRDERMALALEQYVQGYDRELEGAVTPMAMLHCHAFALHVLRSRLLGHYDASEARRIRRPGEAARLDNAMKIARTACEMMTHDEFKTKQTN